MLGTFGPIAPTDEVVQNDNPHGRGWHIIEGGEVPFSDNPQSSYQLFGSRHWLRYESTSGTCGNTWKDGQELYGCFHENDEQHESWCGPQYCPHGENHKYRADYFLHIKKLVAHATTYGGHGVYEECDPHWELGAN